MPLDKNKTRRFQVLDRCFADQHRMYFVEDLQEACRKALANAGMERPDVSRRTILNDIVEMETNSEFNVELLAPEQSRYGKRRFYRYANPHFSIWKIDLNEEQLSQLKSILLMLRQFDNFPQYDSIEDIIRQLEKKYKFSLGDSEGIMSFEANNNMEAMQYISRLFSAIINKEVLRITYQPFGKHERTQVTHPYYLKQYNRRWFLFGLTQDGEHESITNFALDRILSIETTNEPYHESEQDWTEFFYDLMGVTQSKDEPEKIELEFSYERMPYVQSKPIHSSQRIIDKAGGRVQIEVKPTKELYQRLLSFGSDVEVISPETVRRRMQMEIEKMQYKYSPMQKDCTEKQ